MARKVTQNDIIQINELYLKYHTYAEVSRQVGFSPSTVKKYIIPNYISKEQITPKRVFTKEDLPKFSTKMFRNLDNWGELCLLSVNEKEEIKELWNELTI